MLLFVVIVDFVVDCNKNDDDDVLFVEFEKDFCVDVLIVVVVVIEMVVLVNVELFKFFDGVFVDCNFFFIEGEYGMFLFVDVENDSVLFVLRFILFVVVKVLEVDIFVVFIEEEINLVCFDVFMILLIVFFVVFVVDIRLLSVFFFFNEEFIIGFVIFIWGMFVDFVVFFKNRNNFIYVILLYLGNIKNIKCLLIKI